MEGCLVETPENTERWGMKEELNPSTGEANSSALALEPEQDASNQEQCLHVFGFDFVRNMVFLGLNKEFLFCLWDWTGSQPELCYLLMRNENTKESQVQPAAFVGQAEGAEQRQGRPWCPFIQSTPHTRALLQPKHAASWLLSKAIKTILIIICQK